MDKTVSMLAQETMERNRRLRSQVEFLRNILGTALRALKDETDEGLVDAIRILEAASKQTFTDADMLQPPAGEKG